MCGTLKDRSVLSASPAECDRPSTKPRRARSSELDQDDQEARYISFYVPYLGISIYLLSGAFVFLCPWASTNAPCDSRRPVKKRLRYDDDHYDRADPHGEQDKEDPLAVMRRLIRGYPHLLLRLLDPGNETYVALNACRTVSIHSTTSSRYAGGRQPSATVIGSMCTTKNNYNALYVRQSYD